MSSFIKLQTLYKNCRHECAGGLSPYGDCTKDSQYGDCTKKHLARGLYKKTWNGPSWTGRFPGTRRNNTISRAWAAPSDHS